MDERMHALVGYEATASMRRFRSDVPGMWEEIHGAAGYGAVPSEDSLRKGGQALALMAEG
jgi:hypothetical protein